MIQLRLLCLFFLVVAPALSLKMSHKQDDCPDTMVYSSRMGFCVCPENQYYSLRGVCCTADYYVMETMDCLEENQQMVPPMIQPSGSYACPPGYYFDSNTYTCIEG